MEIITSITNEPRQKFNLKIEGGDVVRIYLYFYASQKSWYFDFEYNDYTCNGNKVVLTPNALRHLRKKLPFGIGFLAGSNADPFDVNDFASGRVIMVQLDSADIEELESIYE